MRKHLLSLFAALTVGITAVAQTLDERIPIRGLAIAAPTPQDVKPFIRFIEEELVPAKLNLLIH